MSTIWIKNKRVSGRGIFKAGCAETSEVMG